MSILMVIGIGAISLLAGALLVQLTFCVYDRYMGTDYSCRFMGWHNGQGNSEMAFDGCSLHSTCSKCGKSVMQDGQGNWF